MITCDPADIQVTQYSRASQRYNSFRFFLILAVHLSFVFPSRDFNFESRMVELIGHWVKPVISKRRFCSGSKTKVGMPSCSVLLDKPVHIDYLFLLAWNS